MKWNRPNKECRPSFKTTGKGVYRNFLYLYKIRIVKQIKRRVPENYNFKTKLPLTPSVASNTSFTLCTYELKVIRGDKYLIKQLAPRHFPFLSKQTDALQIAHCWGLEDCSWKGLGFTFVSSPAYFSLPLNSFLKHDIVMQMLNNGGWNFITPCKYVNQLYSN